jgi:hypothetical protein
MLSINEQCNSINLSINLKDGAYCVDSGNSGTGKSFLFKLLLAYATKNKLVSAYFNSTVEDTDSVINYLIPIKNKVNIIILDNYDLYCNKKLRDFLSDFNCIIFVSCKELNHLPKNTEFCRVSYKEDNLSCEVLE